MVARAREELLADRTLVGTVFCRAYSRRVDEWLAELFDESVGERSDTALVAVGGYGRAELSPQSDIDVILLHDRADDILTVAEALWYPIWDAGLKLGHSVRTVKQALALAREDLDTATALLSLRHLAGDPDMSSRLADGSSQQWRRTVKHWLPVLEQRQEERHRRHGEVAFLLEPDLKQGEGGLRDVHVMQWARAAERNEPSYDEALLRDAYETILAARVELHRSTGRAGESLLLEEQDAVAAALEYDDADQLMADIASSARFITWASDEAWHGLASRRRRFRRREPTSIGPGIQLSEHTVSAGPDADLTNPFLPVELATLAARAGARIEHATLWLLAERVPAPPTPWPEPGRHAFERLLLTGRSAITAIEALDHVGLWVRLLPEWEPCRSRPQRNAYHRFTVDRHLMEAAALAAGLTERVDRPDLLVLGALLHDIGKGYPGDHSEVGRGLVAQIASRMGYPDDDVQSLVAMVEHHLLLPDVATRRDLDDDETIHGVAAQVGSIGVLKLLDALTEADSVATGPAAWSNWKAGLVRDLVHRTTHLLEHGDVPLPRRFPTEEHERLMAAGERVVRGDGDTATVIVPDRTALLWKIAGTLAIHGLDVLQADVAAAHGMAIQVFRVENTLDAPIAWERVVTDLDAAVDGRLAVFARLAERTRVYGEPADRRAPAPIVRLEATVHNTLSSTSTVVEVAAPNSVGLLCRIAHALSQLDLDITGCKAQTLGDHVVDSFFVRDRDGDKVTDPAYLREIELSVKHAIAGPEG